MVTEKTLKDWEELALKAEVKEEWNTKIVPELIREIRIHRKYLELAKQRVFPDEDDNYDLLWERHKTLNKKLEDLIKAVETTLEPMHTLVTESMGSLHHALTRARELV